MTLKLQQFIRRWCQALSAMFARCSDEVPAEPVALPPDGAYKRLRSTAVHVLTYVPRGEIVELSFAEVKNLAPGLGTSVKCPGCGRGPRYMFWYQYGLGPNFSPEAGIYMRCQACGHNDYL